MDVNIQPGELWEHGARLGDTSWQMSCDTAR